MSTHDMPPSEADDNAAGMTSQGKTTPRPVRVPGFTAGPEVGLGEVVQRMTSALGVPTCGGCARRAAALNRRVVFTSRNDAQ